MFNFDLKNLHHAYLIEGPFDFGKELISFLEKSGLKCSGNPNFYRYQTENFSILDSRKLKLDQNEKATESGLKKIIIIEARFFTPEAQNALLKVLEEPSPGTHFFIISPQASNLLLTLRSRMEFFQVTKEVTRDQKNEAFNFLKEDFKRRLVLVEEMVLVSKEETSFNPNSILSFLDALEYMLYQKLKEQKEVKFGPSETFMFEEIFNCRKYFNSSGAASKMLLEHLALVLPKVYN